jgi:hypothetical protein
MGFLVLLSFGLFGALTWCVYTRDPKMVRAEALARSFNERVQNFRGHTDTLERHSNEYRSVFDDNEWDTLLTTINRLEQINISVQSLLNQRDYATALSTLERIMSPSNSNGTLDRIDHDIQHLEDVLNWELNLHTMLKKVISNLEVAAVETKNIADVKRNTSTRPTLVTLADIKKQLLEDEDLRKMMSQ